MRFPDLTLALRNLTRRPGFSLTAVLLLALGAGANAAVFSVVRGILLRPLPYDSPHQLVAVWPDTFISNEDLGYWRDRSRSFQEIAAVSPGWLMSLVAPGVEPRKVTGARTSENFFTTLGVRAALGRTLRPGDAGSGASRAAVLSWDVHQQQFGGDSRAVGQRVLLDGVEHEVVGVMPRGFEFRTPGTDVWTPLLFDPSSPQHRATFSQAVGRLRPGLDADQANGELESIIPAMRRDLRKSNTWGRTSQVQPLQDAVVGDVRSTLMILLAAVGLILLLAAVNLGTLVLGRSIGRARELALRTALGASQTRLIRQLLAEQAVLSACGALAGVALAQLALPRLAASIPPEMPRQGEIALDAVVFATIFGATMVISLVTALLPVILSARPELQTLLRLHQSTETPARRRTLGLLVSAQVALAIVLGIGAGLMLRTLWNLQRVEPGFQPAGVLTFRLQTTSRPMNLTAGLVYFEQVLSRVRALPGVTHVGAIQHFPMTGYNWTSTAWRPEEPPPPGTERPSAIWRFVGWDYFGAMGIPLRAGRTFTADDHAKAPAVAIINDALARTEFGSAAAAVGRQLISASNRGEERVEIVGVTGDVRFQSLDREAAPEMYRPLAQTFMFPMGFVVRTAGDLTALAAEVRRAAFAVDPTIPVAELQPLASLIAGSLARPRLLTFLLSVFAAVGLALGAIGVYGVVAYRVRQQERDFGIRLALGAGRDRIMHGVLKQGGSYALLGLLVGIPAAFVLTDLMESVVFGITTRDPATFVALPLAIAVTTLIACAIPAGRAARVDPVTTIYRE